MGEALDVSLPPDARDALLRAGRPREFAPGEVIFHQGDPCDSLFLLRQGKVAVRVRTSDGDEACVGLLVAPDEFGELGLLRDDRHHTATAVALEDVLVLSVAASRFHDLRLDHPALTEWLLHALARRLERTSDLLAEAIYLDAEDRVLRRLLDCCDAFGTEPGGSLPLGQEDVASMAGVSRSTANRALRRLEKSGAVVLGRRRIVVLDVAALRAAAR